MAPRDGQATVTLTWPNGLIDLDLSLSDINCTINTIQCAISVDSTAFNGTMEQVTYPMKAGEAFRIFVLNFSPSGQSFTVQIEIR